MQLNAYVYIAEWETAVSAKFGFMPAGKAVFATAYEAKAWAEAHVGKSAPWWIERAPVLTVPVTGRRLAEAAEAGEYAFAPQQ
jgi:hypothetical protein